MLTLGIIFGLAVAVCQSMAYLFSRVLVSRGFAMARLLVMSHIVMAIVCLPVLIYVWPADMPPFAAWITPVAVTAGTYLLGQIALFYALRHTEASRVAPLLGLKIVVLALLAVTVLEMSLTVMQWSAVVLAAASAFVLNYTGGSNAPRAIVAILAACLCYSVSDLNIVDAIATVKLGDSPAEASVRAATLVYVLLGVVALPMLRWHGSTRRADWQSVLPYSVAWLGAMFALFASIALADVVLANILQSTRGIVGVLLGAIVAAIGHVHLEKPTTRSVFIRRTLAAAMMTLAVALYVVGRSAN